MQTPQELNELDPNKKGKEYCIANAKQMHASNTSGISANFYNQKAKWQLNRKYARGEQPINNTKKVLGRDKAVQYDALQWTVPKIMPKLFDILTGMISRLSIDIACDSVDPESIDKKLSLKYRKEAEILLAKEIAEIEGITKIPLRDNSKSYGSLEELDLAAEDGEFKIEVEIAMEELIDVLFDYNRIKELRMMLVPDAANCGMTILRHYIQSNGLVKIRRVIPELFICDYVTTRDFREMSKAAEYSFIHWSELRNLAGNQFTENEYINIAIQVQGRYGNPTLVTAALGTNLATYANANGGFIFDNYIVCLMYNEWATTDRYVNIVNKPNKVGNKKTIKKDLGYEADNSSKEYTKHTDYTCWYKCNWVTDTEFAFDYGKLEFPNVKANQLNESQSTFAVCSIGIQDMITETVTERVQAFMDNAFLSWMQYQSHLAKLIPPGIYAEMFALSNVPNGRGDGVMTPLENLERFAQTGNLIGNALMPNGQVMQRLPIEQLNGSDVSKLQFFWNQIIQSINMIREVMGFNESTDASNPNPEQSVGGQKLAVQGTNNSLQPIITCIDTVIEKTAEGIINRCQHLASIGQLDYLANAIGRKKLLALSVTKDLSSTALAIQVQPRMSEEEKAYLEQNIQISLQQRSQTGVGGIEIEDAIAIRRQKNIKAAEKMLVMRRKIRQEQDMQFSKQKQEDNAMVQERSIEAQKQSSLEVAAQELDIYKQKKQIDNESFLFQEQTKHEFKKKELILQGQVKDENIVTQGIVDKKLIDAEPKETGGKEQ